MKFLVLFSTGFGLACAGVLSWILANIKIHSGEWQVYEHSAKILNFEIVFFPLITLFCGVVLVCLFIKLFKREYKRR